MIDISPPSCTDLAELSQSWGGGMFEQICQTHAQQLERVKQWKYLQSDISWQSVQLYDENQINIL